MKKEKYILFQYGNLLIVLQHLSSDFFQPTESLQSVNVYKCKSVNVI